LDNSVQERLYIVKWTFDNHLSVKGPEPRVEVFEWHERQKAISRYLHLKEPDKYYVSDLKFQVAEPKDVDIEKLLNSF